MERAYQSTLASRVSNMSAPDLVKLLDSHQELLLIDCRSFMEYHTSHIHSSMNVGGNRLVRRRLMQGKVTVLELISKRLETATPPHFLDKPGIPVVVYDQCSDDVTSLHPECFTYVIVNQLKVIYLTVYLLKGGFLNFEATYPTHCWENSNKMGEDFVDYSRMGGMVEDEEFGGQMQGIGGGLTKRGSASQLGLLTSRSGGLTPEPRQGYPGFHTNSTSSQMRTCSHSTTDTQTTYPPFASLDPPGSVSSSYKRQSLSGPALPVTNPGPTEILGHILLGCQADAMSGSVLRQYGITHVLNVSADGTASPHVPRRHFLRIPVNDNYTDRILPHLQRAFDFLNEAKDAKGRALIHCSAGISRSPTVAISYLMNHCQLSMKEAYDYVKSLRPTVSPNFNFLGQLLELERQMQAFLSPSSDFHPSVLTSPNPLARQSPRSLLSRSATGPPCVLRPLATVIDHLPKRPQDRHPSTLVIAGAMRGYGVDTSTSKRRERPLQRLYSMTSNLLFRGGNSSSSTTNEGSFDANRMGSGKHQRNLLPSPSDELRSLADMMVTGGNSPTSPLPRPRTSLHTHDSIPTVTARSNTRGRSPLASAGVSRPTRSRSPLTNASRLNMLPTSNAPVTVSTAPTSPSPNVFTSGAPLTHPHRPMSMFQTSSSSRPTSITSSTSCLTLDSFLSSGYVGSGTEGLDNADDPLSRFPTTSLDQLHFEPCLSAAAPHRFVSEASSTAGEEDLSNKRRQTATFPRCTASQESPAVRHASHYGNSLPPRHIHNTSLLLEKSNTALADSITSEGVDAEND